MVGHLSAHCARRRFHHQAGAHSPVRHFPLAVRRIGGLSSPLAVQRNPFTITPSESRRLNITVPLGSKCGLTIFGSAMRLY